MWLLLVAFDNCGKLIIKDQRNDYSSPRIKVTGAQNVCCRILRDASRKGFQDRP